MTHSPLRKHDTLTLTLENFINSQKTLKQPITQIFVEVPIVMQASPFIKSNSSALCTSKNS